MRKLLILTFFLSATLFISCAKEDTAFEQECSDGYECKYDLCITFNEESVPQKDGICSKVCGSNKDCGSGATCYSGLFTLNVCLADCESDSDCDDGFVCVDFNERESGCFVRSK